MKRKDHQVFPAAIIVVMVAFISTIFFVNANLSFAAEAAKKKSQAAARPSAVEYTEAQIKQLQDALKLTDDQKGLWDNLTQVMRENAKDMDALSKDRAEKTKTMNAVERMKFHSQITEARLDQMKKLIPPFEALYNTMSDDQKKVTDSIFQTGRYGKHKRK